MKSFQRIFATSIAIASAIAVNPVNAQAVNPQDKNQPINEAIKTDKADATSF
jgi:hypothetical protein